MNIRPSCGDNAERMVEWRPSCKAPGKDRKRKKTKGDEESCPLNCLLVVPGMRGSRWEGGEWSFGERWGAGRGRSSSVSEKVEKSQVLEGLPLT